ncbi:MAG: hypothetical protein QOD00_1998 [Blastocatellia bacterium]|jgi:hypothetical protein|nr:hypothetical protein [Blastocatellia bacterium]
MKYLKKVCAVLVLTCAFAVSALADGKCGEISCPGVAKPVATVTGETAYSMTEITVGLIQAVLSLA